MSFLRSGAKVLSLMSLLALLLPATAVAVELRDAELLAGGNAVLQNGGVMASGEVAGFPSHLRRVQTPLVRNALQRVEAAVREAQARAGHQVPHRA